jgi:hypothetical protein
MNSHEAIYNLWHEYASTKNVANLIELYSPNAIFESPLVPILLNREGGALQGKDEIHTFLIEGTNRRPNDLVRWYRTGTYFSKGNTLIWEYPRNTPDGNQLDILELMEIEDTLIVNHRIYWGWLGTQLLIKNQTRN